MPQVTIDLDQKENKEVEVFKAQEGLRSKEQAIKRIIRKFFNIRK